IHGAGIDPSAGRDAADIEWKSGSEETAGIESWRPGARAGAYGGADAGRGVAAGNLSRGAEGRRSGKRGQLFRDRRSFVIGDAGDVGSEGGIRSGARSRKHLRGWYGGRAGTKDRGGDEGRKGG